MLLELFMHCAIWFRIFWDDGRTERIRSAELMIGIGMGLKSGLGGDTMFVAIDCFNDTHA
jgi:hypothetical protein